MGSLTGSLIPGVLGLYGFTVWNHCMDSLYGIIAGSLESAYSLNWGALKIWGKGGGETLALL